MTPPRSLLLLAMAMAMACSAPCPDGAEPTTWYADLDGDGHGDPEAATRACARPWAHVASGDDCDDGDPDVGPGRIDDCDGIDDDCDGIVDEDGVDQQLFLDVDGDGYGTTASWTGCGVPPSPLYRAHRDGDCDDLDIDVHPRNSERCNGLDDDCDGVVDEDAVDRGRLFVDDDGDGDGSSQRVLACPGAPGTSWTSGDCDDFDAQIHVGAPERCNGLDDDCDGVEDEDPSEGGVFYLDRDEDGWGGLDTARACGPGVTYLSPQSGPTGEPAAPSDRVMVVATTGDCDDLDPRRNPHAAEVCDGVDNDCDLLVDDDDPTLAQDQASRYHLDVDRDGYGRNDVVAFTCQAPPLYTSVPGDCDDEDEEVKPFQVEICDGIDNDCDGLIDASDPQLARCP